MSHRNIKLAIVAALLIGSPVLVGAQSSPADPAILPSALAVGPAIVERVADPGDQVTATVRVTNITNEALPIHSVVRDLVPAELLLPAADKKLFDASKWHKLEPSEFILKAGESKAVNITINAPADASPGGHYATVYFQPLVSDHLLTPGMAHLNARVGVLSFLTVRGEIKERATLLTVGGGSIRQSAPVEFNLPIRNDGNVHLLPQGKVTVFDWRGRQVGQAKLPNGIVLPGTIREYKVQWGQKRNVGFYTARADIYYGAGNANRTTSGARFFIVPWLPIVITLAAVSILAFFIFRTHSRWGDAWRVLAGKGRHGGKFYDRKY